MLFILPLKLSLFLRYLDFCHDFLFMKKISLIREIKLISKFMILQLGKQTIPVHILPNISKSKGNQTMKFGQSIEYNMRNLEKSCTNCCGETFQTLF